MTKILGVKIDNLTKKEVLAKIDDFLNSSQGHYLVTVNPEFLLTAQKDEEFFHILNRADLSLSDGFGVILASWLFPPRLKERISGADLTLDILDLAQQKDKKVAVVKTPGRLSTQEEVEKALKSRYPLLDFQVLELKDEEKILTDLKKFSPVVVFVALGAPVQEKFMVKILKDVPLLRLAMGVGGTFDFLTGRIKRAPRVLRRWGLEWLWRLAWEPARRWKRIIRAVVVFPALVFKEKFINPWLYRDNVACFIYKKEKGKIMVLVAKRTDLPNHWQIPQGGTDGESLERAARREVEEELGIKNFVVEKTFSRVYKYRFRSLDREKEEYQGSKFKNYKGQKQGLVIIKFLGEDKEIKLFPYDFCAWQWVPLDNVLETIHPIRREGMKKFIEKFKEFRNKGI